MRTTGVFNNKPCRKPPGSVGEQDPEKAFHASCERRISSLHGKDVFAHLRKPIGMALGIAALSAVMFSQYAGNCARAMVPQSDSESVEKSNDTYIDIEEDKAYRAAKREKDPQKRAEKLYEFYRKYPESALMRQSDYEEIRQIVAVQTDYYTASKETDVKKRAALLLEFRKKYPDSDLAGNIEAEYMAILKELWEGEEYELLETLSRNFLKVYPENKEAYALIAESAMNLNQFEKCGKALEAIYEIDPSPSLAREIHNCYEGTDNLKKQIEWAGIVFALPDYDSDYMLRYDFMMKFYEDKNLPKAAEYANLTLKSTSLAEQKDGSIHEQLKKVRRVCYHIVASNYLDEGNYEGALTFFKEAVQAEPYGQGYYKIGFCLDHLKQIDDAMLYYAMAELKGEENASEAKSRVEILYKALHNQTLVGIDKVYNKARELMNDPPET